MIFGKEIRTTIAIVIAATALVSCITEESVSNKEREKISLDAWIRLHKPELVDNYQEEGGYYVEILQDGFTGIDATENDFGSEPLMEQDTCWVYTNMTGRDINGSICMTRSGTLADICGTFSHFTHYVPYINYCGNVNMGLLEGTYLAMRNALVLGEEYCNTNNLVSPYKMRKGSHIRLYLPSSIAYGESGSATEGGYEGQYSLDASRPFVLDIEVLGAIKNPSDKELEMVEEYANDRDEEGFKIWIQAEKGEEEKSGEDDDLKLKGLYYAFDYNPKSDNIHDYKYMQPHLSGTDNPYTDTKKYADMAKINMEINQILLERFGEGIELTDEHLKNDKYGTLVGEDGRANVWYVLRFLDGFVVDTNIAEVRKLVFGETDPVCEVFSYSPSDDKDKAESERQAIGAWYYCIPKMHHGAFGRIVTTSGYAYGAAGLSGTTTTETSSSSANYYNALNYYNYSNSYYNYYSPYYNYYDYNYYNYNYDYSAEDTTTTTTISTEILPYTPLVFTIYVEPYE